jgi:hypothetical protein
MARLSKCHRCKRFGYSVAFTKVFALKKGERICERCWWAANKAERPASPKT